MHGGEYQVGYHPYPVTRKLILEVIHPFMKLINHNSFPQTIAKLILSKERNVKTLCERN